MISKNNELFSKVWRLLDGGASIPDKDEIDSETKAVINRLHEIRLAGEPDYTEMWEQVRPKHRSLARTMLRYAAVAIPMLLLSGSAVWLLQENKETEAPETQAIMLTLQDGTTINLEEIGQDSLTTTISNVIVESKKGIAYSAQAEINKEQAVLVYHTLEIPRMKSYKLKLADGTVVWLNSETKLRYPASFGTEERKVCLLGGEAYFEIARDTSRPFRVEVNGNTIEALGTQFNIDAYPEYYGIVHATLLEGSVKVYNDNASVLLQPGEQAECTLETVTVSEVNRQEYSAWKYGQLIFTRKPLCEIMFQMERWYDIIVDYDSPVLQLYTVTGMIDRENTPETTFQLLEKVIDVRFERKENTVIVRKKE